MEMKAQCDLYSEIKFRMTFSIYFLIHIIFPPLTRFLALEKPGISIDCSTNHETLTNLTLKYLSYVRENSNRQYKSFYINLHS